jgi:NADH dehydrogenase
VLPLAGADARFQPVWVEDVAAAIVRCLDDRSTIGLTLECCGPRQYTLQELAQAAGTWSGRSRPVVALPAALGRLQALAMEWLPGEPLMSRDNLDSMRVPSIASGKLPGLDRLGIEPAPLEAIAPLYLGDSTEEARMQAWRSRARRG